MVGVKTMIKSASEAREIIKNSLGYGSWETCEAKGYLDCFEGLEVKALIHAIDLVQEGLRQGSIRWAKPRLSESDPYHPANTAMCEALAFFDEAVKP